MLPLSVRNSWNNIFISGFKESHSQINNHYYNHNNVKAIRRSLIFLVFYPVNLDFVINELVHVGDHGAALDVHQDETGDDLSLKGRVSSCRGARVNIKLVLMLVRLKLVCVAGNQNVTVQLSVE